MPWREICLCGESVKGEEMKRFLWNSDKEKIYWDNGKWDACAFRSDELGMFETDYRGSEPREIQSAEYNPEIS